MAALIIFTSDELLSRGLKLVGIDAAWQQRQKRETNIADYKSYFGVAPIVHAQIWEDLQTTTIARARIDTSIPKGGVGIESFLFSFHFLRTYGTERQRKGLTKKTEKTASKWLWYFLTRIQALKEAKIVWPADNEWQTHFIISCDGVHVPFHETIHPVLSKDPNIFSPKLNGPGMSYELALHLWEPRLVWVKWNPISKRNDRQNFTAPGGLRSKIPEGKKAVTDRDYRGKGGDPKVAQPNSHDCEELQTFKARAGMRQESFHSKIERFGCLTTKFRHTKDQHVTCFEAICVICQYKMELGSPVFDV